MNNPYRNNQAQNEQKPFLGITVWYAWLRDKIMQYRIYLDKNTRRREIRQAILLTDRFITMHWKESDPIVEHELEWPKIQSWQLGDIVLKHERYIRGDIISYTGSEELATWVDQTYAFGPYGPGRGDFHFHPSFTLELVESLIAQYQQS